MARTNIVVQTLDDRNKFSTSAAFAGISTAVDATDGAEIDWKDRDDKHLIFIQNVNTSAAKTATIKAGNGIQGVNDLEISIPASSYTFVAIDSGRFKNMSGINKGKVIITGASADIKVACFKLP